MVAPFGRRSIPTTCACFVPSRVFGAGATSAAMGAAFRGRPRRFAGVSTGASSAPAGAPAADTRWSMFRRGLWVNLLNPKAIVFFLAFLPQFIRPADPLLPQYATVAVTAVAVDIAVMWGFFAVAAQGFRRFTRTARGQRVIDVVFGSLFLAVALLLALIH